MCRVYYEITQKWIKEQWVLLGLETGMNIATLSSARAYLEQS